jgi:DNA-binding response OmpR family regulator
MSTRILVVDDEARYLRLLQINLATEGYQVMTASNGIEAIDQVSNFLPDLILMDIVMPRLDGISTCERIRQFSNVPIIMLTARGAEEDKVRCLNIGADDYITKPFSATEVLARVRAVLRRTSNMNRDSQSTVFSNGCLRIDYGKAEVWKYNRQIPLTATEYRLLIMFSHNLGKVITADELLSSTWGPQYREDKEILWVSIARLRQKLEDNPKEPELIVTRSGLGYVMPQLSYSPKDNVHA